MDGLIHGFEIAASYFVGFLKSLTAERIILFILGISSIIAIFDFVGFLPASIRDWIRLNRADDTLCLLEKMGVDVERYKRNNEKFRFPPIGKDATKLTEAAIKKYKIERKVSAGRTRKTELPYYIDLIGATCNSKQAVYFASLLSTYWHYEVADGRSIPCFEFDFIVTPKEGSPILGYEFSKIIDKQFVLHESKKRFSSNKKDMRVVFDCENVPKKGSTALIVDDSTTGGTMVCQVIDDLRYYDYKVFTCLVVFEPQVKNARERLKNKEVDLISIVKTHT